MSKAINRVQTKYEYIINSGSAEQKTITVMKYDIVKVWVSGDELVAFVGRISQISEEFMIIDNSEQYHKSEVRISTQQIVDMEVINDECI